MAPEYAYENTRRVTYQDDGLFGTAQFIPVCENCGRYVKADETIKLSEAGLSNDCNATCSKCGRTHMIFEGFF